MTRKTTTTTTTPPPDPSTLPQAVLVALGYPLDVAVRPIEVLGYTLHRVAEPPVTLVSLERQDITPELVAAMLDQNPERLVLLEEGFGAPEDAGRAARLVAAWGQKYGSATDLMILGPGLAQRVLPTKPRADRLVDAVVGDVSGRMAEGDVTGYVVAISTLSGLLGQVFVPEAEQIAFPELLFPGACVRVIAAHIRPIGVTLNLGPEDLNL